MVHQLAGLLRDLDSECLRSLLLRQGKVQLARHRRNAHALDQHGNHRDEEYDVEDLSGARNVSHDSEYGEDDRSGSFQTYPGDEHPCPERELPERQERDEHRQRTAYKSKEYSDEKCHGSRGQHLLRVHEEPKREEHSHLHQPGDRVAEPEDLSLVGHRLVAYDHTGEVDGEESVAVDESGDRVDEEPDAQHEDGIE